jgi:hypothetical protein
VCTSTRESPIRHRRVAVLTVAAALVLAACASPAVEEPTDALEDPVDEVEEVEPADEEPAARDDEEPAAPEDEEPATEPLAGEPSTGESSTDGEHGTLAVTDVRVATHDGFDRIVFELEGDGVAGWHVGYVDEPLAQGSGHPVDVEGEAVLAIAVRSVTLPPELPDEIEVWDRDVLTGAEGGVVVEVVNDTIFEGQHTLFAGLDAERPFLVERFEDPQRIVIDVFHDT